MPYKVLVDKEACIGCGTCIAVCPSNFEMKDGKSQPKKSVIKEVGCSKEAADACPVSAIKVSKS